MNRQILIKEYADYGFTVEEICKELNLWPELVKSALEPSPPVRTEIPAKSISRRYFPQYAHATDKSIEFYELLYKYGPRKLNRWLKVYGQTDCAEYINCDPSVLFSLKIHFGYHRSIPGNALELCTYFPEEVRRQVDERDHRICVRCHRHVSNRDIRYHKISHPGPVEPDNCATLCRKCRSTQINRRVIVNRKDFKTMRFDEFCKWIEGVTPFRARKTGQILIRS